MNGRSRPDTASFGEELLALERLARESSSEKRRELMVRLSAYLTENVDEHSDGTVSLLGDILMSLLDDLDERDRAGLSFRIAPCARTPLELARVLAFDESLAVAEPLLEHSPVLKDDDLVAIASSRPSGHLLAMTRREDISDAVTDAIAERGSPRVLQSMAENAGAHFSDAGFRRLAAHAGQSAGVAAALARRVDVPPSVAETVIAAMPEYYRARLAALWAAGPGARDKLISRAAEQMDATRRVERRRNVEARIAIRDIENGTRSLEDAIVQFAGSDRVRDAGFVIAARAKLPAAFVHSALFNLNGTAIALICRSINLKDHAFEEVVWMRCARLRLPFSTGHRLIQIYRTLDGDSARRTVRFTMARAAARRADAV